MKPSRWMIKLVSLLIPPFVMWGMFLWLYRPVAIGDNHMVEANTILPSPTPAMAPIINPLEDLQTRSYVVMDYETGQILAGKNPHRPLPPASTTKIMTALVALDFYQLSDVLEIPEIKVAGSKIEFQVGEKWTVDSLLQALLIQSGNDAAVILGHYFPGGESAFVEAMNRKAAELGLEETHFVNPTGLDDPLHLSSAHDLARLADIALKNKHFEQIVGTRNTVIKNVDDTAEHMLVTTNELLGQVSGVLGVKTGWTEEAGQSLVTLVERDGRSVLIAVLGSEDRFGDTKKLIEWAYGES